jgi:hypothetical protein
MGKHEREKMSDETVVEEHLEYGLQLPNGQVTWGTAIGRPINTEPERQLVVLVLRKTAEELGFPEAEFLSRFKWVPRNVQRIDRLHSIDDSAIVPAFETPQPQQ